MIHYKNRLLLLLSLLCIVLTASAASEAEYQKLEKSWTLRADGSQEFRYNMELTLYTHAAMNSVYGESFIVYNPDYQELKINSSYTKQKDGTIVRTPDNALVECLPFAAADAPAYNQLKEMVVVHTGLELGATVYLDYTLISKPGYLPEIDLFEELRQTSPVKSYTLTVTVPESKTLAYKLNAANAKPTVKTEGGLQTTTWTLRNLPASPRESFTNVACGDVPYLAATTYAGKKEALATLLAQFNREGDPQLATLAETLTEGKQTDEEKLKAIHEYVIQHFDNNHLTLEATGYRLRKADAVIATAYGTEAEQVNLLNGLLNAAGLQAEPVASYLVDAGEGAALKAIRSLLVSCRIDGKTRLLMADNAHTPLTVNADVRPFVSLRTGEVLDIANPAEDSAIKSDITISFKEGQMTTATKESIGKALATYYTPVNRENETVPLNAAGGYATITLPEAEEAFSTLGYSRMASERTASLWISRTVDETYNYTIECPDNMTLRTPSGDKSIRNAAGTLTYTVQKEGKKATVTRSLKLNKRIYTASEYPALRQLLTAWHDGNSKTLLFSVE